MDWDLWACRPLKSACSLFRPSASSGFIIVVEIETAGIQKHGGQGQLHGIQLRNHVSHSERMSRLTFV
jgi:hypothetical protein